MTKVLRTRILEAADAYGVISRELSVIDLLAAEDSTFTPGSVGALTASTGRAHMWREAIIEFILLGPTQKRCNLMFPTIHSKDARGKRTIQKALEATASEVLAMQRPTTLKEFLKAVHARCEGTGYKLSLKESVTSVFNMARESTYEGVDIRASGSPELLKACIDLFTLDGVAKAIQEQSQGWFNQLQQATGNRPSDFDISTTLLSVVWERQPRFVKEVVNTLTSHQKGRSGIENLISPYCSRVTGLRDSLYFALIQRGYDAWMKYGSYEAAWWFLPAEFVVYPTHTLLTQGTQSWGDE